MHDNIAKEDKKNTYTPFTSRIDDPIAQHKSTATTDEVSATEFLHNIGVWISTVGTNQPNREIGPKSGLLGLLELLGERKRLRVGHDRQHWATGSNEKKGEV